MLQKTKSLLTKCLAFLFIVCCVVAATVGMVACSNGETIASIKLSDGKLVVTYTNGKTDSLQITADAVTPEACKHANTNKIELSVAGCDHHYLLICADCGAVAGDDHETIHTWSDDVKHYERESCLVGAHNALYCVDCGTKKADSIVYDEGNAGKCYDHAADSVITATYTIDAETGLKNELICECITVTAKICKDCQGTVEVLNTVPAAGHKYGDWTVSVTPGSESEGQIKRVCTVCGKKSVTDVIPALYLKEDGELTTIVNSKYTYTKGEGASCSAEGRKDKFTFTAPNGETLSFEVDAASEGHYIVVNNKKVYIAEGSVTNYVDGKFVVLGGNTVTCATDGVAAVFACEECEGSYSVKVRKAHAPYVAERDGEKTVTKEATCTDAGDYEYTCSVCKETATQEVPALGHDIITNGDNAVTTVKGDNGVETYKISVMCSRCTVKTQVLDIKSLKIEETEATCDKPAAIVYTNIVLNDGTENGTNFVDKDGKAIVVSTPEGAPKGHVDGIVENGKYDYADLTVENVTLLGNKTLFICKNFDGSSDDKWFSAVYKCTDCQNTYSIKVKKSHVAKDGESAITWQDGKKPTCQEGAIMLVSCKNCCSGDEARPVSVAKLDHNLVYTLDKDNKVASVKCLNEGCTAIDDIKVKVGDETVEGSVKAPVCNATGSAVVVVDEEEVTIVLAKSENHTFANKVMNGTKEAPVAYVVGLTPINGGIGCKIDESLESGNAMFVCSVCGDSYTTYAIKEHTYVNRATDVAATCTTAGKEHYSCSVCQENFNNVEVPALGHAVEWKVIDIKGTKVAIDIRCTREGCTMNKDFKSVSALSDDDYIDLNDYFTNKKGEVVIATESTSVWNVETVIAGTCTTTGVYRFTLTETTLEVDGANYVFATPVTFDVEVKAGHYYAENAATITWNYNGKTYTGKYCSKCQQVVLS